MHKNNVTPASTSPFPASSLNSPKDSLSREFAGKPLGPPRRLIVLVPDCEVDIAATARKVWELGRAFDGHVQFLGLCSDMQQESTLRRQIVTMSAMVADDNGLVESKIEYGKNWLTILKSHWRDGDEILCFEEQYIGLAKKPLSQILKARLNAPVYVLSGLYLSDPLRSTLLPRLLVWAVSLATLAGFFWLDVKIAQMPQDWAHVTLLYFSILVEAALIWTWNAIF